MPPAAAPMMPPFTLSRLVEAPMIAPAAAPMAASRLVCFTVTVAGSDGALLAVLPVLLEEPDRRVELEVFVARGRAGAGAGALLRKLVAGAAAAFARSAAEMESSRAFGLAWAASERSLFRAGSAGLSLLHAADSTIAGATMMTFRM